jgi:XTP/dITP diphosphohydrolase
MKELLVATGNRGKLKELEELLSGVVERVRSLADFPAIGAAVEDGATFEANAIKKARHAAQASGLPAIADDSGLVVDALAGRPGVFSARFAGEGAGDGANNARLLTELAAVPTEQRGAAFRCVIAFCLPGGECRTFSGEVRGTILATPAGEGGFGYDPLFLVPEYAKTMAELPLTVKNRISHRGRAFALLREYLETYRG